MRIFPVKLKSVMENSPMMLTGKRIQSRAEEGGVLRTERFSAHRPAKKHKYDATLPQKEKEGKRARHEGREKGTSRFRAQVGTCIYCSKSKGGGNKGVCCKVPRKEKRRV